MCTWKSQKNAPRFFSLIFKFYCKHKTFNSTELQTQKPRHQTKGGEKGLNFLFSKMGKVTQHLRNGITLKAKHEREEEQNNNKKMREREKVGKRETCGIFAWKGVRGVGTGSVCCVFERRTLKKKVKKQKQNIKQQFRFALAYPVQSLQYRLRLRPCPFFVLFVF